MPCNCWRARVFRIKTSRVPCSRSDCGAGMNTRRTDASFNYRAQAEPLIEASFHNIAESASSNDDGIGSRHGQMAPCHHQSQHTSPTWYRMSAHAKDGNIVCFFQSTHKFMARYVSELEQACRTVATCEDDGARYGSEENRENRKFCGSRSCWTLI